MRPRSAFAGLLAGLLGATLVLSPAGAAPDAAVTIDHAQLAAVRDLADRNPDRYAGVVLDADAATVRLFVRGSDRVEATKTLRSLAAAPTGSADSSLRLHLVPVRHSMRDLSATMNQVPERQPFASVAGKNLSAWYVDPAQNKVVIGMTQVTPEARSAAAQTFGATVDLVVMPRHRTMVRRDRIDGDKLEVRAAPRAAAERRSGPRAATVAAAPTRLLDAQPYYGGSRIVRTYTEGGSTYVAQCTAAFTVTTTSTLRMSTAGHCGATGTAWQQGYLGGNTLYTTGSMGSMASVQWGDGRMDAAVLSGGSYWPGAVYGGQVDTTAWGVTGQRAGTIGEVVCSDGSVTREVCGAKIHAVNACLDLNDDGTIVRVCNQTLANAIPEVGVIVQPGDSGGPVHAHVDANRVQGIGIISGGSPNGRQLNYTQIQNFSTTFNSYVAAGSPAQ
ncbi:alpha-lytic protease prodomain-containing protein [Micromonospora echinospora]|uniref:alpha-lytic protease prodomain-containing protein n=1 Tax=Micromonospora echinospora TaxID=1877 RepID=UPI003671D06E